jgi:hypothetical protein
MTQERQNSGVYGDEQVADSGGKPASDEAARLYDVLSAAREYIAAVKEQQKGGVGKAWAQLVKRVGACEEDRPANRGTDDYDEDQAIP